MIDIKLKGLQRKKKRIGRGYGSAKGGHTVGRGSKGQKARSKVSMGFEGGQVPLYKKLPQLSGFRNPVSKKILPISLSVLNVFDENSVVEPKDLIEKGITKRIPKYGVKILATGNLEKKLKLKGFLYSDSAREKIEKSGTTIE